MARVIFTTKPGSLYDDLPEAHYHFPKTYLNHAKQAVGDFVLYYEPRRNDGRRSYYATAILKEIVPDPTRADHYYANVTGYLEFPNPVAFRQADGTILESALSKEDDSVNKGAFGRSVRLIPAEEFDLIVKLGHQADPASQEVRENVTMEEPAEYARPIVERLIARPFRDVSFSRTVLLAYQRRCAITGLAISDGSNRFEVEAAHIRPVGNDHGGNDSPRNGLALCQTIHWMFDQGILSITDDYKILAVNRLVPDKIRSLFNPDQSLYLPNDAQYRPHTAYLKYHREEIYIGD